MHRTTLFACILCTIPVSDAFGTLLRFDIGGLVTFVGGQPYGASIAAFAPVSGHFIYDTTTPPTNGTGAANGSSDYRQTRSDGLSATFGSVPVSASSYAVIVSDNVPQPGGDSNDIISIEFSSALNPPLNLPLNVNGITQSVGLFDINLVGPASVLTSSALPSTLSLSDFSLNTISFFNHTATGSVDVMFILNSMAMTVITPEPSAVSLLATGIAITVGGLARRYSRRR